MEKQTSTKKKSPLRYSVLLLVVVFLPFLNEQFPQLLIAPQTVQEKEQREQVDLLQVIDGDTIKIVYKGKEQKARLLLIDTPESFTTKTGKSQPYGKEASDYLETHLQGKKISIEFENTQDEVDQYGRLLVYVFADNQLIQEQLLVEGYARIGYENKEEVYYERLQQAEEKAKDAKINIWSIPGYVTKYGFREN